MKQLPVVKVLRLTLELAAVVLIVSLTLIAAGQKEQLAKQEKEIEQLNRDKTALMLDYSALQKEAGLSASGGY
jgi:hypothetical protein|nr:MAG TPA: hypothetical protein [Caudoviricetes sp.]